MKELPRAASAVLQQARRAHDPSAADVERSLSSLHDKLPFALDALDALEPSLGQPVTSALETGRTSGTLLSLKLAKLCVVAALVGGAAGALLLLPSWRAQRDDALDGARNRADEPLAERLSEARPTVDHRPAPPFAAQAAVRVPPAVRPEAELVERAIPAIDDELPKAQPLPLSRVASAQTSRPAPGRSEAAVPASSVLRAVPSAKLVTPSAQVAAQAEVPSERVASDGTAIPPVSPSSVSRDEPAPADLASVPSELELIDRAATSLRDGAPGRALSLLDEHLALYPGGILRTERQGLRVLALCAEGRTEQARRERAEFLLQAGRTPMAARVRRVCAE